MRYLSICTLGRWKICTGVSSICSLTFRQNLRGSESESEESESTFMAIIPVFGFALALLFGLGFGVAAGDCDCLSVFALIAAMPSWKYKVVSLSGGAIRFTLFMVQIPFAPLAIGISKPSSCPIPVPDPSLITNFSSDTSKRKYKLLLSHMALHVLW